MWTNQGGTSAPTSGQASPYRLYTYNANGEPTQIEHRDAVGSPVVSETLKWDGMGKLREVMSNGSVDRRSDENRANDPASTIAAVTELQVICGTG